METLSEIPFLDWELLPTLVLKEMLSEVKENFAFKLAETQSITQKSIQLIVLYIPFVGASILYLLSKCIPTMLLIEVSAVYLFAIIVLVTLIKTHWLYEPGITPYHILTVDFEGKKFDKDEKEKLLYKNLIEHYWRQINEMKKLNRPRMRWYNVAIIVSLISFILTGVIISTLTL